MRTWIRPRPLGAGDTIGIAAPSGSVGAIRDQVEGGIAALEQLGYRVKRGRHLYDEWMGFAGTHAARIDDWNGMLRDPDVRMVMAATGGSVAGDRRPARLRCVHRRPQVGKRYVTIFLNALAWRTGIETLHGPDVAFSFGVKDRREFEAPLFERLMSKDGLHGSLSLGTVRVLRPG